MIARNILIAAFFLSAGGAALAQPYGPPPPAPLETSGVYVGLRGSYAFSGNGATTWAPTTPMVQLRGSYASGGGGSVLIGAHLPLNLRAELEAIYRYQPVSKVTLDGVDAAASGRTHLAAPMLNIFWDIPTTWDMPVQPFVGMGVGAAFTDTLVQGGGNTYMRQSRWDPAYSFMTGFALPLDDTSRITAMYRWMQVRDAHHKCAVSGTVQSVCLENNVNSQAVDIGYELEL